MSRSSLVLPLALVAACTDAPADLPPDPTTPVDVTPVAQLPGDQLVIATGGAQGFAIDDALSVGYAGDATAGFTVEPDGAVWPNTRRPLYWVHAEAAATGSFEIATNHGIASGLVEAADLASVAFVPTSYQLDGSSPFALDVTRPEITVELRAADGRRLVDATLGMAVPQTAWDRGTLPAKAARHLVLVWADSIGETTLAVDVVDGTQRIERRTADGRTCFHAYAGDVEIATAMTFEGGTALADATNCVAGDATGVIAHTR
ncbi:MAG TPA: hypothetical protein VFQ53_19875 [Kofleriaceae bacterium]|nr:hypothetical protein [Kofleriaceae bacterium]